MNHPISCSKTKSVFGIHFRIPKDKKKRTCSHALTLLVNYFEGAYLLHSILHPIWIHDSGFNDTWFAWSKIFVYRWSKIPKGISKIAGFSPFFQNIFKGSFYVAFQLLQLGGLDIQFKYFYILCILPYADTCIQSKIYSMFCMGRIMCNMERKWVGNSKGLKMSQVMELTYLCNRDYIICL